MMKINRHERQCLRRASLRFVRPHLVNGRSHPSFLQFQENCKCLYLQIKVKLLLDPG
ncbi:MULTISPECIES: hypothetical protein [Nostoc]|uniref:Uncharacterized protein n=2 Tax=Nostoc TaxID=1177 RepID=A0ABR8I8K3_9NOSO|nr:MULTISPECIES: hypothetical protein [Nostoc]MBD2562132.1 hypothetical protein [Nostoc linckia FACHB-391]MBD2647534.1 hypothetical protein [Nostoc foliaceum FACHB-393]